MKRFAFASAVAMALMAYAGSAYAIGGSDGAPPPLPTKPGDGSPIDGLNWNRVGGIPWDSLGPTLQDMVRNAGGGSCQAKTPWGSTINVVCGSSKPRAN